MRVAVLLLVGPIALVLLRHPIGDRLSSEGDGGASLELTGSDRRDAGLPAADRTRVLLIDGLGLEPARRLLGLTALCESGIDLVVDVGFPTISLPVQHVLWTGLTQQQSGVVLDNDGVDPPAYALPARVPGSIAVSESHLEIARSFGFASTVPETLNAYELDADENRAAEFEVNASSAAESDAKLVFFHSLMVDRAGHLHGGASEQYEDARYRAGRLARELVQTDREAAAERGDEPARWFVLADHGHLPGGGHKGAEPSVRMVRACIFGPGIDPRAPAGPVHLVDVSRALAESLGLSLDERSQGRSLDVAIANPEPGATLPRPSGGGFAAAVVFCLVGLGVTVLAARRFSVLWPWWFPFGLGVIVLAAGVPTLSNFKSIPWWAVAPGPLLCAVQAVFALREATMSRVAVAQLALPASAAAGALAMCGAWQKLLGLTDEPPLVPYWSATAAVVVALCAAAAFTIGVTASGLYAVRRVKAGRASPDHSP